MRGVLKSRKSFLFCFAGLFLWAPAQSRAQAELLLEEPYSYDGMFAGTGHAAIYLSRVCAESPTPIAPLLCGGERRGAQPL